MKKNISPTTFTILSVFALMFSSCKWGTERETPRGKNIICVVDFSDSKNANERLTFYMSVIKEQIIPKLEMYDKITVMPIDKASITNSSDIFLEDLSQKNFEPELASAMEEEELIQANFNKYKTSLVADFEHKFNAAIKNRSPLSHGTDILGALEVAKGKLKSRNDNYIVLLSDMMNWSKTLNLEPNNKNFNSKTLDDMLSNLPAIEMPNTRVLILTAEQVEISPEHFQLVSTFWKKYFEKNKISLFDYNSASVAKLNELMSLPVSTDED